ncbi:hypothetical protein JRO89_XS11G0100700 [Xanthoceras sorbifolium]|uniref:Polygalacturonase n=1 Tax=Xanthoceras sorbifolium TaxID=99658 RepID=A0ABQ8HFB0_9ROSI|nr:hypothetical protein JRO89_XS11G0100700 [Xanthoceras sorbifolium]
MALQRHFVPIISIIFLSLVSCCFCLPDQNPPYNYLDEAYGYDSRAYPSYFTTINVDGKFKDLIKPRTQFITLKKVSAVSVDDFGAKGDGTDDSQAFMKAWKQACSHPGAVLVVPEEKTYLLKPIRFSGPCKANTTVQPCKDAPTALTFYENKNLIVKNLNIEDAQQIHVSFKKCTYVLASNLIVTAPEHSPNTDGIHVTDTQNIQITSSTIRTGDDCISIVNGSQNVKAEDITCGPGHGISIGSLGAGDSKAYVSGVTVNGAKLSGTTNGVRIKTWQGGSGYASNIKFQNIEMFNVTNPIIVDQNYCDQDKPCKDKVILFIYLFIISLSSSAVEVKNVVYQNIKGTSASKVAVKFDCSKKYPCEGIVLENINLEAESSGGAVEASCNNVVQLSQIGPVTPRCP